MLRYIKRNMRFKGMSSYYVALALTKWMAEFTSKTGVSFAMKGLGAQQIRSFRSFILSQDLSSKTKHEYLMTLKRFLREAWDDDYTCFGSHGNISRFVEEVKFSNKPRVYLTLNEALLLKETPCPDEDTYALAMISMRTGMRYIDIVQLRVKNILQENFRYVLKFKSQKTQKFEVLYIGEDIVKLLHDRMQENQALDSDDIIFNTVDYNECLKHIRDWCEKAGISKEATFHSFRHTHAMMLVEQGVDIHTISSILGHSSVTTTQIYAKISDKSKEAAMDMLGNVFAV